MYFFYFGVSCPFKSHLCSTVFMNYNPSLTFTPTLPSHLTGSDQIKVKMPET